MYKLTLSQEAEMNGKKITKSASVEMDDTEVRGAAWDDALMRKLMNRAFSAFAAKEFTEPEIKPAAKSK